MFRSSVLSMGALLFASTPVLSQGVLGLSVNGQVVVPVGQLESFIYAPGQNSISIRSFYKDIRCDQLAPFGASGFALELDQLINVAGVEPEAKYDISTAESITYHPTTGEIAILLPDVPSAGCTHEIPAVGMIDSEGNADPGAFWLSSFDPLFDISYTEPEAGEGFRIVLKNRSEITPFRDITVRFAAPAGATIAPQLGTVIQGLNPGEWIWSVPLLWPHGAQEDETLVDVFTASLDQGVSVQNIESLTRESYPATEPVLVTVVNTSTSR